MMLKFQATPCQTYCFFVTLSILSPISLTKSSRVLQIFSQRSHLRSKAQQKTNTGINVLGFKINCHKLFHCWGITWNTYRNWTEYFETVPGSDADFTLQTANPPTLITFGITFENRNYITTSKSQFRWEFRLIIIQSPGKNCFNWFRCHDGSQSVLK